ncbi:MAG: glucose-6-phosphate isomerase, partial [Pseudomonadota bacterium]
MIKISKSSHSVDSVWSEKFQQGLKDLLERQDLGFFQIPDRSELWSSTLDCAQALLADFDDFVFVGIGGSGLGGRTVANALSGSPSLHFLENVDQHSVDRVFGAIDPEKTAFVVTSKSGGTLETLALTNAIEEKLKSQSLTLKGRSVVITEPKSNPLSNWGERFGARRLEIPVDVGGRFSVLSPVGLLPAALLGASLGDLKAGALWAKENAHLSVELAALIQQSFERGEWVTQFWVYSDRFATFGDWLQQLWAESLGKKVDRNGSPAPRVSTPMACVGANDQHSILQQVAEGERDKFLLFFRIAGQKDQLVPNLFPELKHLDSNGLQSVLDAEGNATLQALSQAGVSYAELELE